MPAHNNEPTPFRSKTGRSLKNCSKLAKYLMEQFVLCERHYQWDDLVFAELFNRHSNGTPQRGDPRNPAYEFTPEETMSLLAAVMLREKANFTSIYRERRHIPREERLAVDSAVAIALRIESIEAREERRKDMRLRAEIDELTRRTARLAIRKRIAIPKKRKPVVLRPAPGKGTKRKGAIMGPKRRGISYGTEVTLGRTRVAKPKIHTKLVLRIKPKKG